MQVTWEQFEDPLWIIIRLITSWMSKSCCFDGRCLSCKMPPLPSSLKNSVQFGLVPLRVQVIMKMLLWLLSSFLSTVIFLQLCFFFLITIYFTVILQFLAFLLICSLGLYMSGNFHSLTLICTKVKPSSSYAFWNSGVEFYRCQVVGILMYVFFLWYLRHVTPIILKSEPNSIFSYSIYYKHLIGV